MDKLQPIIKHHFWIVFLIAIMLPPAAWWMTTGELAAEISDRTSSLDSTFSGIASGQGAPNDDWANGVNMLIDIRKKSNRKALDMLWMAQTDLMVWPPNVAKWMNDCPYRGEIDDVRIKQILPDIYRGDYELALRRVWLIPEPVDDPSKTRVAPDLKQKVVFPYESLPRINASKWAALPPTWQEIWNAQEDLWLLSEVLDSVRKTNDSTSSITDSYVKQIMQVQLFGGNRAAAPSSAGGGSTTGSPYMGMPGMPGGSIARRGAASALSKPAEFPIGEEYEVSSSGGTGAAGGRMENYMSAEGGPSGNTAADPNSDESRYLQSEEAYRTRGFKLKVAIHQMQVPTLIRELLNSQYPIEIIRFQQSAMNPEEPGKPASNSSTYPGGNPYASAGNPYSDAGNAERSPESEGGLLEDSPAGEETFGFEGEGAGKDGLSGKSYAVPATANVQAALQDRDLVELVVIGEIYIYNPPAVDESASGAEASEQLTSAADATPPASVSDTGVDGPAVPVEAAPPGNANDQPPAASVEADPAAGTPESTATSETESSDAAPAQTEPGTGAVTPPAPAADASTASTTDTTPPEPGAATTQPAPGDAAPEPASDTETP